MASLASKTLILSLKVLKRKLKSADIGNMENKCLQQPFPDVYAATFFQA
jgi:hypothetical protein